MVLLVLLVGKWLVVYGLRLVGGVGMGVLSVLREILIIVILISFINKLSYYYIPYNEINYTLIGIVIIISLTLLLVVSHANSGRLRVTLLFYSILAVAAGLAAFHYYPGKAYIYAFYERRPVTAMIAATIIMYTVFVFRARRSGPSLSRSKAIFVLLLYTGGAIIGAVIARLHEWYPYLVLASLVLSVAPLLTVREGYAPIIPAVAGPLGLLAYAFAPPTLLGTAIKGALVGIAMISPVIALAASRWRQS